MRIGRYTVTALEAGRFKLDGGAMHGVVPKTLWSRVVSCDADNRCDYSTTCLLVEGDGRRILVETGNGAMWTDKERGIYAIEQRTIEDALGERGLAPDAIDTVVFTHLHFDHAGGAVRDGRLVFPRARHVAQRQEWDDATRPHERNRASYLERFVAPLAPAIDRADGETEIAPGVRVLPTPGHTRGHQSILVEGEAVRVLFLGDVVPTRVHVPLAWVMAYDLEPAVTVETKRRLLGRAADEGWIVVFGHDPSCRAARLARDGKGAVAVREEIALG